MVLRHLFSWGRSPKIVVRDVSVHEAHEGVTRGLVTLVDVRRPDEWAETGRPKGSHGITLQDDDFVEKTLALIGAKTSPVALSCRTGGRSSQAAQKLVQAGFTDIANVVGGFLEWEKQGLPIDLPPFDG